jgi:autotransporter-associated beta strand protein
MRHDRGPVKPAGYLSLLLPLLLSGLNSAAQAQTFTNTWIGGGGNSNWSNSANWDSKGIPASGAGTVLDFTGTAAIANNNLGTFQLNYLQFDVTSSLTLQGNALNFVGNAGTPPAIVQNSASNITIANNLALGSDLTVSGTGTGNITLSGTISGSSQLIISANGTGDPGSGFDPGAFTTIISGANNSYTGGTTITGGVVQLGANNALPTSSSLTLTGTTADSTFDLNGHQQTLNNITLGDGSANALNSSLIKDSSSGSTGLITLVNTTGDNTTGNITVNPGPTDSNFNPVTPTSQVNANVSLSAGMHVFGLDPNTTNASNGFDLVVGGQISGTGDLYIGNETDISGAFVVFNHANTYTGSTNVMNGSLYLGATNALPTNTPLVVAGAGQLYLYVSTFSGGTSNTTSYNQTIGTLSDASQDDSGNIYLGTGKLTINETTSTTFTGTISDNDGFDLGEKGGSIIKTGSGTLTYGDSFSSQSTYTGSTTVEAGKLLLGANDILPEGGNGIAATNLIVTGGTFETGEHQQTVNAVTNSGGTVLIDPSGSVQSVLTVATIYNQTAASAITQVDGTLVMSKSSATLQLSGGELVGTGTVSKSSVTGATLTNSGGTVSPHDIVSGPLTGKLTINGSYTQSAGGKLLIDLGGSTTGNFDVLAVTNAKLAGALDVKLVNGFTPTVGETFNFLTYSGTESGTFASYVGMDSGYSYTVSSYGTGTGSGVTLKVLTVAAVPEASTLFSAALMLGTGGVLVRRRR